MLKVRYQEIQEYKELFEDEFYDYNLVFCNAGGRPLEHQIITRFLQKLIRENDLPPVVFHSHRHSSITYKLKLNGGDIKSVQDDSGHAQVKMVTDVYSHILDEDRRLNAQRFEETLLLAEKPISGQQSDRRAYSGNSASSRTASNYRRSNAQLYGSKT